MERSWEQYSREECSILLGSALVQLYFLICVGQGQYQGYTTIVMYAEA
jgi:hypothetical protein